MPQVPQATRRHSDRLAAITAALLIAARRVWQQVPAAGNWQDQYDRSTGPQLAVLVAAAQMAVTRESDSYVAAVLGELGFGPATAPGVLNPAGIAGYSGAGVPVSGMLGQVVARAGETYSQLSAAADLQPVGAPSRAEMATMALGTGQDYLDLIAHELTAEAARAAESAAIVDREWVEGYVRMLDPPSCSRCAVLAGKFYRWNKGFDRHPGCDCVHIPASEQDSGDLRTNPNLYFDSLDQAEQDRVFTIAGAQAIRDGADIWQVVNARGGMRTAQLHGRNTLVTTTGTTRRAWFGGGYAARKYGYEDWFRRSGYTSIDVGRRGAVQHYRERRTNVARLMPEAIYAVAKDRGDAIRLLKMYGFVL